jgi:hypothetical protein
MVSVLVAVLVVCVLLVSTTGLPAAPGAVSAQDQAPAREQVRGPADVKIVTVDPESEDRLWPYTSRQRRFETLTLPINVVVRGNDAQVRWFLMTGRDVDWNESEGEWQGIGGGEVGGDARDLTWYEARGATRYTYIHSPRARQGGWVDESYQLHDGDYFGTRYHIRAYTGGRGNGSWTAIQAHHEHWDWFRLRHTVGSTATARQYVERSFHGSPSVERVARERFANGGISDADGWVTVAVMRRLTPPDPEGTETGTGSGIGSEGGRSDGPRRIADGSFPVPRGLSLSAVLLAGAVLSLRVTDVRDRLVASGEPKRLAALAAVSLLTMPSIRWLAITVERSVPDLSPKVVAGLGYLVVAVGLPVAVAVLARGMRADRAASLAAAGFGTGVLLDYALLGIAVVPTAAVLHRLTVAFALGVLAAAGARFDADRFGRVRLTAAAALVWVGVLVWPLLDAL